MTNRCYAKRYNLFSEDYLKELAENILASPYLAASQLSENFTETKGFSVIFKRSGIDYVIEHFPFFQPYLQVALKQGSNAFYLNPLVLETGAAVAQHIDCSISSYGMALLFPTLVSVLYVKVPDDLQGGELVLHAGETYITSIVPSANTLLYFQGRLLHAVNPVQCSQPRISLICEQYRLTEAELEKIPEFEIKSAVKL